MKVKLESFTMVIDKNGKEECIFLMVADRNVKLKSVDNSVLVIGKQNVYSIYYPKIIFNDEGCIITGFTNTNTGNTFHKCTLSVTQK